MGAGDEKQDELDKLFSRPESGPEPKPPGDFTRAFFGVDVVKPQKPAEAPGNDSGLEPAIIGSPPPPVSASSEFSRAFGTLNADAPPKEPSASTERAQPGLQTEILSSDPGTLTDLFANRNQVLLKPLNPQSDTFTRFFGNEALGIESAQSSTSDFTHDRGNAGLVPPLSADASTRVLPKIDAQGEERPINEIGTDSAVFGDSPRRNDPQKATRLFSLQKSSTERGTPSGGPSAFTRVIDASALRSAEEKPGSIAPLGNNPLQQPPPAATSAPPPAMIPQWPAGSVPPIHPSAYLPQQPMPVQVPMPPMASWPQVPSVQAVTPLPMQQPQVQFGEQAPQSNWIKYLPLIIGLNVLFFLAVVLILIVALNK